METWKVITRNNFENLYEVSDKGIIRKINGTTLSTNLRNGYLSVCLYNPNNKKKNTVNVHRLVASTFLEQGSYKMVNHKNGDKTDNRVENLEWVTAKENTSHAIKTGLSKPNPKKVQQYSIEGKYIETFDSIIDAAKKTGTNDRRISDVCKGKRKTTNGFIWKYEIPEEIIQDCEGKIIEDFPKYKITEDGKVFSIRAKKYLVPKILSSGYHCVKLCNNGVSKDVYIQKLVREYYPPNASVPN